MLKNILNIKKDKVFFISITIIIFIIVIFLYKSKQDYSHNYDVDILIKNTTILTLNENSQIINDGWIAIKENRIINIGNNDIPFKNPKTIIDGKGKVAMPGLVNTHSHIALTLLKGVDDDSNLSNWISNINAYEKKLSENDVYWGSLLGEIEMIKSGTTTFNDMYFFDDKRIESINKTGIRAVIDIPFSFENNDLIINSEFLEKYKNEPTITFSIAPNPLINFSKEKLIKINEIAKNNDLLIHLHIEENRNEKNEFLKIHNLTPLQLISNAQLFNNKIILAHSINFTNDEIDYISKQENASLSFNPKSNIKLTGQTANIKHFIDKNINIGLGTDSSASGGSLDIFDHMNFIAFSFRNCDNNNSCEQDNKPIISSENIIKMATINGAKTLGLESDIGSLEVGKKADIILINLKNIGSIPSYDIFSNLVYNTDGSDVSDSIIDGKIIMRDGILKNINEKEVIEQVNLISKKIKSLK
ncbi:MAG: amidohydrolase [Patescibacteria group bacterium]|nr:amidohydrolase [Patescibacteria group bacterium]